MKFLTPALLSTVLVLSACGAPADTNDDMPPVDTSMEDDAIVPADDTASSDDSAADDTTVEARVIEMTVDDWTFSPAAITAAKGEKVIVRLIGVEGIHSFAIAELGINARIEPGQTVDVVIPTDTAGTFAYLCRVPCGPGHRDMKGSLVIS